MIMQVLPQGTNIQGVYLAFGLDGSVELANSTYGIQAKPPQLEISNRTSPASPSFVTPVTPEAEAGAGAGAAAWRVTPLVVGEWYNLSVSVGRQSSTNVSFLQWAIAGAHGTAHCHHQDKQTYTTRDLPTHAHTHLPD